MKENYIEFKIKKDHKWVLAEICNAIRENKFISFSKTQIEKKYYKPDLTKYKKRYAEIKN